VTPTDVVILASSDVMEDTLRGLGARGSTLQALIHDMASCHRMPARVRDEALAAARIRDRLKTGTMPVLCERELWLTGIVGLSEWIEAQNSNPDAPSGHYAQAAGCAGPHPARRPQPWMVLAVVVSLVALSAGILHDERLHTAPGTNLPGAGHLAVTAIRPSLAPAHHERWPRARPVHDSGGRGRPDFDQ